MIPIKQEGKKGWFCWYGNHHYASFESAENCTKCWKSTPVSYKWQANSFQVDLRNTQMFLSGSSLKKISELDGRSPSRIMERIKNFLVDVAVWRRGFSLDTGGHYDRIVARDYDAKFLRESAEVFSSWINILEYYENKNCERNG